MKRLALILIAVLLFTGGFKAFSQILDNPPRDVIYYDNDLQDTRPVPYPPVGKANIMWSKRRNRFPSEDEPVLLLSGGAS